MATKIRIKLKAYDHNLLTVLVKNCESVKKTGAGISDPYLTQKGNNHF